MSQRVASSSPQLSRNSLGLLPITVGGLALCFALGLGCNTTSEGGTGGTPSGSGGKGSGGTGSGGTTAGTGGVGTGGTGGITGSGGKTGNGGSGSGGSGSGGKTGNGGSGGEVAGAPGSGGSTGPGRDGGPGREAGVAGAPGSGGSTGTGVDSGGGGGGDGRSAGCGKTSTITDYNKGNPISISVGGQNRRYILQIPNGYKNDTAYKFILAVHALDSNDKTMYDWKYYGLQPLSKDTVIFAAPNGQKGGQPCSGNSVGDSGCGWPSGNIPLMDAVVKQVTDNFCVDMNHIYATGWSYGASMSYEIGCQRPLGQAGTNGWGVRAIAIYSGAQMSGSCKPSASYPVAFYESHGTGDTVLNYDGGLNLAKNFATANGCSAFSPAKASSSHICTSATGCKSGYPTEFCSFNGGHTPFPDSGSSSNTWGPDEVWKFLGTVP
jgi:poly(3-hydroxybutyrate) depolymerase